MWRRGYRMTRRYICNDCGFKGNAQYKMYEHLNESSEEDKIYQKGKEWECGSFREVTKIDLWR